jgi:hypothetical protein
LLNFRRAAEALVEAGRRTAGAPGPGLTLLKRILPRDNTGLPRRSIRQPIAIVIAVLALVGPGQSQDARTVPAQLEVWISAIERHVPGERDDALLSVLRLRSHELEARFEGMVFVLDAAAGGGRRREFDGLFRRYSRPRFSERIQRELRDVVEKRVAAGGVDRFAKRAAMLHADLGIIAPDSHLTWSAGTSQRVSDGTGDGDEGRSWNWMLGRAFLHLVHMAEEDEYGRLWYHAIGNHLWGTGNYVELDPHGTFRIGPGAGGEHLILALPPSTPALQEGEWDRLARYRAAAERVTLGELDERLIDLRLATIK